MFKFNGNVTRPHRADLESKKLSELKVKTLSELNVKTLSEYRDQQIKII